MPYFVYKISQPMKLELLDSCEQYQEARAQVRERRRQATAEGETPGVEYRLIFARQQSEAERLLSTPRDERVIGED
ncbi:MAG: hypothetical protein JXM75_13090 [Chromatiaceae bacterium]|nr:hypothetical protein [Chromatiaceae bacterium]